MVTIWEDFEDQDVSDWDNSNIGANSWGTVADAPTPGGTYCGEFTYSTSSPHDSIFKDVPASSSTGPIWVWFKEQSQCTDDINFSFQHAGTGALATINLHRQGDGSIQINGGNYDTNIDASDYGWLKWTIDNIDFSGETYDWTIEQPDGTVLDSETGRSFRSTGAGVSQIDRLSIGFQSSNSSTGRYRFDYIGYETPPAAPTTLTVDSTTSSAVDLSATDNADNEDGFEVHRSTTAGFTPDATTKIADLGPNADATVTYTDPDPIQGDTAYYKLVAYNAAGSATSNEASTLAPLPAPTLDTLTPHDTSIDVAWTDNADDETDQTVYWREPGGTWSSTSVGANTTSHTITGLANGTDYEVYVEAVAPETTSTSTTKATTTTVPTVTGAALDASVADEFTLTHDDTLNVGTYRTEFKESSATSWLSALAARTVLTAADSTTDWTRGSNTDALSTVTNPSEDGTAIRADTTDPNTHGPRLAAYNPSGTWDLSGHDRIQFWYYTDNANGQHYLELFDSSSNQTEYDFASQVVAGAGTLIQIDLSADAGTGPNGTDAVDLTDVTEIRWVFDGPAGEDKFIVVDSVAAGSVLRGHDDTSLAIPYLEDGEEYDIRVRGEGPDAVGAWTTVTAVTKWPPITGLTTTAVTKTSIDWAWTDVYDNEDNWIVTVERQYDYGYAQLDQTTYGPNQTSHSDTTLSPGNTYRVTVRAETEHVYAEGALETTTTSSGKPRKPVRSQGWFVEVEHPTSGNVHHPTVLDGATQLQPTINGLPRVEIAVPRNEKWQGEWAEQASMEVWKDGERLPVDTLVDVRTETGGTTDRNVLVAEGGRALKQTVTKEVNQADTHVVAEDLVTANTSYTANFDTPNSTIRLNELVQDADTQTEFESHSTLAATDPFERTSSGVFAPVQTSFFREGESYDANSGSASVSGTQFSGQAPADGEGFAEGVATNGDYIEWQSFTPEHAIPEAEVGVWLRTIHRNPDGGTPGMRVKLDGQTIADMPSSTSTRLTTASPSWADWADSGWFGGGWAGGDLTPAGGPYTIRVEIYESAPSSTDDVLIDCLALVDNRYYSSSDFDDSVTTQSDGRNTLSGPQDYADGLAFEFADFQTGQSVSGGRIEATTVSGNSLAEVALSNDQGASWQTSADTNTYEVDFASGGATLRWRATFDGQGTRTSQSPTQGFERQELDAYDLYADIDETPLTIDRSFDDHLDRILTELASEDFVWAVTIADDGTFAVEWTQPGQRVANEEPDPSRYTVEKSAAEVYEKVTVVGSSQSVTAEGLFANHGTAVSLNHDYLVDGSETVYDPDTGTNYERGSDYEMSYLSGEITALATGSISDGQGIEVDYRFETRGSFALDNVSNPLEAPKVAITGLTSERACEQAAIAILNEVSGPLYTASVTIPTDEIGFDVVEALDIPGMPSNGPLEIQDLTSEPGQINVELGSRETFSQAVQQFRDQINQVSRRS